MSLTTDGLALGSALAITVGSAIQAKQAYTELNAKTPATKSVIPLLLMALWAAIVAVVPGTERRAAWILVTNFRSITVTPAELAPAEVAALPSGQAAVLTAGKATALTTDQLGELARGNPVTLTSAQRTAMTTGRVADIKKWLGLLLGWILILIGALAAVAGAVLTLANEL